VIVCTPIVMRQPLRIVREKPDRHFSWIALSSASIILFD
jgi:hypothetical protein